MVILSVLGTKSDKAGHRAATGDYLENGRFPNHCPSWA